MATLGVVDRSASIGAVAQTVMQQNTGRQYLLIQNLHDTAEIWVRIGASTVAAAVAGAAGCIRLISKASLVAETGFIPSGAISVISDTASTPVTILEG